MKKGIFIVFEGIDGSGKSTISNMFFERINSRIGNIYRTFEPTDSPIGDDMTVLRLKYNLNSKNGKLDSELDRKID